MVKEKYKKLGDAAVSLLPGGQYYVAKKKGKTGEELKWFKRLEYGRAVFLAEAAAAALIGDYPHIASDIGSYVAMSLPANVEKTDSDKYELEKTKLLAEKGRLGTIRRSWHEIKTRLRDAVSDPEVATYLSLALASHNLAWLGKESMLYKTLPEVDIGTHFAGGVGYSRLADKLYERGNIADYLKEKFESAADKIDEKKSRLHSAAKGALRKIAQHPKAALGMGTIAVAGAGNELFEKAGDTIAKSAQANALFGETISNSVKDWFVNMSGSFTYYYDKYKKRKPSIGENEIQAP